MFVPCFVMQYFVSFLVLQSSWWGRGSFALVVFLASCNCYCSVAFLHGAMDWSAVCDCGISLICSLTFLFIRSPTINECIWKSIITCKYFMWYSKGAKSVTPFNVTDSSDAVSNKLMLYADDTAILIANKCVLSIKTTYYRINLGLRNTNFSVFRQTILFGYRPWLKTHSSLSITCKCIAIGATKYG